MKAVLLALIAMQATTLPIVPTATPCPATPVQLINRFPEAPVACALCKSGVLAPYPGTAADFSGLDGMAGTPVFVTVTMNPDGSIKSTAVVRSAGTERDQKTIGFAREAVYKPATVNCEPVEGTFLYKTWWYVKPGN